jgi:PAS domain S-box-containing protein
MDQEAASRDETLKHYRILSEMVSDYAFHTRIGEDGVPILDWMSDSWARDFGYRPGGPEDVFEHVHPDDRRHVAEQWSDLLAGRAIEGELRMQPRSGRELWVHYRVRPIVDTESGRVVGTYGALQDIQERKMAEELWRQAEARFRAQYQSSPIPTFTWRRVADDFVLIDSNRSAEQFTDGAIARWLGKTARDVYRDRPDMRADMDDVFATGRTIKKDLPGYRLRTTGETKHLVATIARVAPNMVMMHVVDLTDLHPPLRDDGSGGDA